MPKRRLLDATANRAEVVIDETHLDGKVLVHEVEDCDPYIAEAKRLSDQTPGKDLRHAAVVPHFVYAQAIREGWANDPMAWKRWANDPDNAAFRTWPGQL